MNIVILDDFQDSVRKLKCADKLFNYSVKVYTASNKLVDRLVLRLREADVVVLIYGRTQITDLLVKKLPRLKLIVQIGHSLDHIDMEACTKAGIAVVRGFELPYAQAETVFALLMTAAKRTSAFTATIKHGAWQQSFLKNRAAPDNFGLPVPLRGRTLVLLGINEISRLIAKYAQAFQMRVVFWDEDFSAYNKFALTDCEFEADLTKAFTIADFLSVHLDYKDSTKHLITKSLLQQMKAKAIFININHPLLIAPNSLYQALKNYRPGIGVVDTYEVEPPLMGNNLITLENCLCTPHISNVEDYYYEQLFSAAFDNILKYIAGEEITVENPQALSITKARN